MSVHNRLYVKTELYANRVDGTDLSTQDWAYLGTVDQNLAKADEVEFKTISITGATAFATKLTTAAASNYTLTFPVDDGAPGEHLTTDGAGNLTWDSNGGFDQSLNTTDSPQFVDLTLTGDLTVQGTTTLINTTNTEIKDNIILLNSGEAGAGVGGGTGTSGIEVERGSLTNQQLVWDETNDYWTVGEAGGAFGTTIGRVVESADTTHTQGAIPGYDANGRLDEAEGLTSGEVDQLQNIDSVTISNTQWGYIGAMDQGVSTTDNVTFNDVTVNGDFNLTNGTVIRNSINNYTTDPNPVSDGMSIFDTTTGAITATLPASDASSEGKCFTLILKTKGVGNDLTVAVNPVPGTDTIEGSATCVLDIAGQHITVCSCGNGSWLIM